MSTAQTTPPQSATSLELFPTRFPASARLALQARQLFPNGVTHDGRYLEPFSIAIDHASGSRKYDVDGHEYIDYWMGHGSLLLGHSHPKVVAAVQRQAARATHPGASHREELEWAQLVHQLVPSAEKLRFVNSGTEATLMALRISRIVTGRSRVLKFAGHFHGWHDLLIPAAEPPYDVERFTMPGITDGVLDDLIVIPPNDLKALVAALDEFRPACVILEPTGGHWGQVPIRGEFLNTLRSETSARGIILIFDEVITGFRVAPGGAQAHYNVRPDLTTLAKILAGGLPGGCLAGKADLLAALEFDNPYHKKMKHPGTYNGNPLSAAAGIAALREVATGEPCRHANDMARLLRAQLNDLFSRKSVDWVCYGEFSMAAVLPDYHGPRPATDDFIPCDNALASLDRKFDPALTHAFRRALLLSGVDFFGWRAMLSAAHTPADIDRTTAAFSAAIDLLRAERRIP